MEKRTYTVRELADLLGIAVSKTYEHVRNGDIPGVIRLGRRIILRKRIVDDWLDGSGEKEAERLRTA